MINMHCRHFKIKKHISFEKKKNGVVTMKLEFSMDTLNDNFDNAKSCQWERFILQFAAKKISRRSIS